MLAHDRFGFCSDRFQIKNPSFEYLSGWTLNTGASITSENPRIGSKALKLTQDTAVGPVHGAQSTVLPAGTYTLSAYVKIDSPTAYARLQVGFRVDGSYSSIASSPRNTVGDYTRISFTFTVPEGCERTEFIIKMNGTGTVWYDCVQLEVGDTANDWNMLENAAFSNTASGAWGGSNLNTSTDGYETSTEAQGSYYKIAGSPEVNKRLYQTVYINKTAKDIAFSVSGKACAASVPLSENRYFALEVKTFFTDGTTTIDRFPFNPDIRIWQYSTGVVVYKSANENKTVNYLQVGVLYSKNANQVLIDDMMLTIDCTGTTYVYAEDGTLLSAKDNAGRQQTFTHSDVKEILSATSADNKRYDFTYDTTYKHRLLSATSQSSKVKFSFSYNSDGNGNLTSASVSSAASGAPASKLTTTYTYTAGSNYLASVKDAANMTTQYAYDVLSGALNTVTDANGTQTSYTYNTAKNLLTAVSVAKNSTTYGSVSYAYNAKNQLTSITGSTHTYTLTYDAFGNTAAVDVGSNRLVTHVYDAVSGNLTQSTYGNGVVLTYEYDSLDRIKTVKQDGVPVASYTYNALGQLAGYTDQTAGVTYRYTYDLIGRLLRTDGSDGTSFESVYDNVDKTTGVCYTYSGTRKEVRYEYDETKDSLPKKTTWESGTTDPSQTISYDHLERVASVETATGSSAFTRNYSYQAHPDGTNTTPRVSAVSYTGLSGIPALGYTYDNNGNITALKQGSATKESYTYDALNQLTRVDSLLTNKTTVYAYDNGGNITSVKEYAYTTGSLDGLTPTSTKTYTYGNASWPDLLTAYDGDSITYDAIGNPTSYRGASMTWSGRRISSYSKSGVTVSYVYNESGIRTSKTVNGTTTEYFLSGNTILAEKTDSNITWYLYDSLGSPVGYEYGGAKYWYITNLQGDILYVVNSAGTPIGSYTYSPYGDFTATVLSSSDSTAFSANHITYRGYYNDSETGFYYVSSRYYDPEIGRWISADDAIAGVGGDIRGYNLFAYCMNDPVNMSDHTGHWPQWIKNAASAVVSAVKKAVTVVVNTVKSAVSSASNILKASSNSLPKKGEPGSSQTLPNPDGTPKQERWYGPDGNPERDRDYNHPGNMPFPHDHEWKNGERGKEHLPPDPSYKMNWEPVIGVSLVAICTVGIIAVAADDLTGVGVADDFLFGPLGAGVGEGLIMIFG